MGKILQDPKRTMHQHVLGIIELQGTGSLPINGEFRLRRMHSKISKKTEPNFLSLPKISRLHPSSLGAMEGLKGLEAGGELGAAGGAEGLRGWAGARPCLSRP